MVTRLVLKLLLKACVPLIAVVGVMSYLLYLQGGDPAAVFSKITSGISGKARDSVQQAGQSFGSLKSSTASTSSSVGEVHTWVDEHGVTHYSTSAREDGDSETVRLNPNANVVASVPTREPASEPKFKKAFSDRLPSTADSADGAQGDEQGALIPGTDGLRMPVKLNRDDLTKFLDQSQRPSPERLGAE